MGVRIFARHEQAVACSKKCISMELPAFFHVINACAIAFIRASPSSKSGAAKQPSASDFYNDDDEACDTDGAHEAWVACHAQRRAKQGQLGGGRAEVKSRRSQHGGG